MDYMDCGMGRRRLLSVRGRWLRAKRAGAENGHWKGHLPRLTAAGIDYFPAPQLKNK